MILRRPGGGLGFRFAEGLDDVIRWVVLGLGAFTLMPWSFALLPITRRRARTRWRHFVRIALYGLFVPVTVVMIAALLFIGDFVAAGKVSILHSCESALARYVLLPMTTIWWFAATKQYLRLPRPALTVALLSLTSLLTTLASLWMTAPNWLIPGIGE